MLFIDGATNLLNWEFQSRYHSKVDHMVNKSHIILSTMATARKVTPSKDPVECVDPDLLLEDLLTCLQKRAYMPPKIGMYASKEWHVGL